jgi:dipeptidyl aminopeptidase/acylaminoacyl peptidase
LTRRSRNSCGDHHARDEWRFDWLAQFNACPAALWRCNPNLRGSGGCGDGSCVGDRFRSWPTAISDGLDAGGWPVAQGNAPPGKLGIVGWSYGG